ncbi:nesprin-2 isoform X2 [Stegostoma tigrinum]|nr:nesprin-2 isoform X2 [Stegostoma tigrinum]XP_059497014.1 nesprin-2 isoform X2 [Stegostoma tigrinum]
MHRDTNLSLCFADRPLWDYWVAESEDSIARPLVRIPDGQQCDICAPSLERRIKMEQAWQLWQEFLDDYSRFNDWMHWAEALAKEPLSSQVLYSMAKEELKRFECLQKRTEEHMIQLESINIRYRRLAREQGIRLANKLKGTVHDGNQRWDNLQRRVGIICKRLKYFVTQREELEAEKENLWLQLMQLDIQRSELEYFSREEAAERLHSLQQATGGITEGINALLRVARTLLQKCEPQDGVTIEAEVQDLLRFQQEVFGQVDRLHRRCHSIGQTSDRWESVSGGGLGSETCCDRILEVGQCWQPLLQHLLPEGVPNDQPPDHSNPSSLDSLPLEWDSSVDIGDLSTLEGSVSLCSSELDQPGGPDAIASPWGSRRSRQIHSRRIYNSSMTQLMDVGCQCNSEVNMVSGDHGPLFDTQLQVRDRLSWDVADAVGNPLAGKLTKSNRLRKWQHLDQEATRAWAERGHSDWLQGQNVGPTARAKYVKQWLQQLEPKQKLSKRGTTTLEVAAGVDRLSVTGTGEIPFYRFISHCPTLTAHHRRDHFRTWELLLLLTQNLMVALTEEPTPHVNIVTELTNYLAARFPTRPNLLNDCLAQRQNGTSLQLNGLGAKI